MPMGLSHLYCVGCCCVTIHHKQRCTYCKSEATVAQSHEPKVRGHRGISISTAEDTLRRKQRRFRTFKLPGSAT